MSRKSRKRGGGRNAHEERKKNQQERLRVQRTSKTIEPMSESFEVTCEVAKVDESMGLVFGWAIVSTEGGEPYYDLQGDHIPEEAMLKAAAGFMANSRRADEMHSRKGAGTVTFAFPLTRETANAFGIQTNRTGLMVAVKPDAAMLKRFASGELRGFSIGGRRVRDEPAEA